MIAPGKIFSATQIKAADRFTIEHEPVSSIDLVERAATRFVECIKKYEGNSFFVFCGPGNNGADGLAIARLLKRSGCHVIVFIIEMNTKQSPDLITNKERLLQLDASMIHYISSVNDFPQVNNEDIVIDAIFGTGLSRPVTGLAAECIHHINRGGAKIISVDVPSGLFADTFSDPSSPVIQATHTISFQFPKLAFFFPSNALHTGNWEVVNIGLSETFITAQKTDHYFITPELVKSIFKPRQKFSHKGTFGHALLVAGSYGKAGAAVLCANACLRSGAGLLTVHLPKCATVIMQIANPEAMVSADSNEEWIGDEISTEKFSATGIGPGMGVHRHTQNVLHQLLLTTKTPLVLDADALNILGMNRSWLDEVPPNSILTPHPKEFERMAGTSANDFQQHQAQISFSKRHRVYLIVKGAHTCITTPTGESYFNTTGNPGMAKGGSGDVLTGILTGILAQGYTALETCLLGVFIHGHAGDLAKAAAGEMGMTAKDLCKYLPGAFKQLYPLSN